MDNVEKDLCPECHVNFPNACSDDYENILIKEAFADAMRLSEAVIVRTPDRSHAIRYTFVIGLASGLQRVLGYDQLGSIAFSLILFGAKCLCFEGKLKNQREWIAENMEDNAQLIEEIWSPVLSSLRI